MSDDTDLRALGRAEAQAQTILEPWRSVAEGRASVETIKRLETEAQDDPETARLLNGFRPMTPAEDEALTAHLLDFVQTSRRGRRLRTLSMAAPLLAAGIAAVWLGLSWDKTEVLPAYRIHTARSDLEHRGAEQVAVPVHRTTSALSFVVRPAEPVHTPVEVATYYEYEGRLVSWSVSLEVSPRGAVRIDGRVQELLPGVRGPVVLIVVVAASGKLPDIDAVQAARATGQRPLDWRLAAYAAKIAAEE